MKRREERHASRLARSHALSLSRATHLHGCALFARARAGEDPRASWSNLVGAGRVVAGGIWFPSGHRHALETLQVPHEFRGARRPRTRRLATGLCAIERRSVSDRQSCPGTVGCPNLKYHRKCASQIGGVNGRHDHLHSRFDAHVAPSRGLCGEEGGVDDDVGFVAADGGVELSATGDQPQPGVIDVAVHLVGRELGLGVFDGTLDFKHGDASV